MEEALHISAHLLSQLLEAATLVMIALGALLAMWNLVAGLVRRHLTSEVALDVWQGLSRWMIVGLEFLFAADLVSTVVSPTWDELARLGAIATIRTVLGFFLGRDVEAARKMKCNGIGKGLDDVGEWWDHEARRLQQAREELPGCQKDEQQQAGSDVSDDTWIGSA